MIHTATFSPDRLYRYTLWRKWDMQNDLVASQGGGHFDRTNQYLMMIGLNPSTADETVDDPTIRRCVDFAQRWGFGSLCMANLFAWRDTSPRRMKRVPEPVGAENNSHLLRLAKGAGLILAAWGKDGGHMARASEVLTFLSASEVRVHCLKLNGDGSPSHPLYIPADTLPVALP